MQGCATCWSYMKYHEMNVSWCVVHLTGERQLGQACSWRHARSRAAYDTTNRKSLLHGAVDISVSNFHALCMQRVDTDILQCVKVHECPAFPCDMETSSRIRPWCWHALERHCLLIALRLEWTLDLQTETGHETSLLQMRCFGVQNLNP